VQGKPSMGNRGPAGSFPHHRDDERVSHELPLSHVRGSVSTQIRASRAVLAQ
jgi:hypothetical protein